MATLRNVSSRFQNGTKQIKTFFFNFLKLFWLFSVFKNAVNEVFRVRLSDLFQSARRERGRVRHDRGFTSLTFYNFFFHFFLSVLQFWIDAMQLHKKPGARGEGRLHSSCCILDGGRGERGCSKLCGRQRRRRRRRRRRRNGVKTSFFFTFTFLFAPSLTHFFADS